MTDVKFSARAYAKVLLHAIKYPHCAINGLLLGKYGNGELSIVDAVPLFHISLHLAPMGELALNTVEQLATELNLEIAGYYAANENINDTSIDKPAHRAISEKLTENFDHAIIAMVDNKELSIDMDRFALKVSQYSDGKWKVKDRASIRYEGDDTLLKALYKLNKDERYRDLYDFDNHLDDVSLDWRNRKLNKIIDGALQRQV
ncbi:hypothetical protein TKK_0000586 [Trichogramma kaykai]|uniref:MPN domain-containing protein n=1 Tax=Trichogramma kaykai TaxID=54128 RepID=A0ABD2W027_9HYME